MRLPFRLVPGRYDVARHFCRTRSVFCVQADEPDGEFSLARLAAGQKVLARSELVTPNQGGVFLVDVVEAWGFSLRTFSHFPPWWNDVDVVFDGRELPPPAFVTGHDPPPADLQLRVDEDGDAAFVSFLT